MKIREAISAREKGLFLRVASQAVLVTVLRPGLLIRFHGTVSNDLLNSFSKELLNVEKET